MNNVIVIWLQGNKEGQLTCSYCNYVRQNCNYKAKQKEKKKKTNIIHSWRMTLLWIDFICFNNCPFSVALWLLWQVMWGPQPLDPQERSTVLPGAQYALIACRRATMHNIHLNWYRLCTLFWGSWTWTYDLSLTYWPEYDSLGAGEEHSEGPGSDHHQPGPPPLGRPVKRQQRRLYSDQPVEIIPF